VGGGISELRPIYQGCRALTLALARLSCYIYYGYVVYYRKIIELEEELKVVSNNMKSLEIAEQEVRVFILFYFASVLKSVKNIR